jgi:hypothetical protein
MTCAQLDVVLEGRAPQGPNINIHGRNLRLAAERIVRPSQGRIGHLAVHPWVVTRGGSCFFHSLARTVSRWARCWERLGFVLVSSIQINLIFPGELP